MSLDVNSVLNNISKYYNPSQSNKNKANTTIDANIFAQASQMVKEYKAKQKEAKNNKNNNVSTTVCGLSFTQVASMSTKDFLKYAYENQTASGFNKNNDNSSQIDTSKIKLPMIVSYKGRVVCTAGMSFMSVVAKIKAKCKCTSEEKIAAALLAKYGNNLTTASNSSANLTGNSINISA